MLTLAREHGTINLLPRSKKPLICPPGPDLQIDPLRAARAVAAVRRAGAVDVDSRVDIAADKVNADKSAARGVG